MILQAEHINKFKNQIVLVAVSGGVDSMVLCDLMLKEKIAFEIAHINYSLRGKESDKDLAFVIAYAKINKIPCHTSTVDSSEFTGKNIQEHARIIRYNFFRTIMQKNEIPYLATAHHLNDKIEGSIMNFFRGTDVKGLIAIQNQSTIIRPLLGYFKHQILAYAKINKLEYRQDKTNEEIKYSRNFIRNKVLPELNTVFPNVEKRVFKTIKNLTEKEQFIESYFDSERVAIIHKTEIRNTILKKDILDQKMPSFYLFQLIKDYGFSKDQCKNITSGIENKGKEFWTGTHVLVTGYLDLVIEKLPIKSINQVVINDLNRDQTISLIDGINLKVQMSNAHPGYEQYAIDVGKVDFPLTIRAWKQGDYIRSAKMNGSKKTLKSLYNDNKIDKLQKNRIPVISDNNNEIICIPGYAVSNKLKSTTSTSKHLWFTLD